MVHYQVKDPQGKLHIIDGPEGATPDEILAQAQKLIPSNEISMGDVAKSAVRNAFGMPGTITRDLASDPVTQAKVLPPLLGTVGALSPIPMGATLGTVGGRQLSNLALKAYGKPEEIPSTESQILEGGTALLGDVAAIPAVKKAAFGKQIGAAEKAAGVITRAPDKLPSAGNVGEFLNTLENQLKSGAIADPQTAKDAYAIANYITGNPNLVGKSNEILVQSSRVRQLAQNVLNQTIPERLVPAVGMRKAMAVPRLLGKTYSIINNDPIGKWLLRGAAAGAGFSGAKKLLGEM